MYGKEQLSFIEYYHYGSVRIIYLNQSKALDNPKI